MDLHGLLLIDKTAGITSYDVIRRLKRILPGAKIGHTGTLDPFATGLLVVLVGEATKLSIFLSELDKEYLATAKLGEETDTQDCTGRVVRSQPGPWPSEADVRAALASFEGRILQKVPSFSAAKFKGKPFYEMARRGEEVPEREREVEIHRAELVAYEPPTLKMRVVCGKGVYVRALAADLGARLGTVAHLAELRRVRWGGFNVEHATSADALGDPASVLRHGVAFDEILSFLPRVDLDEPALVSLRSGLAVKLSQKHAIVPARNKNEQTTRMRVCDSDGNLSVVAEAEAAEGSEPGVFSGEILLRPLKILHPS
ncbi:MAG: tRNA pseudouridine(55) synthase TruB [Nitrospirae bacterium]|nr:tRNA pseudouridine(55) synthase TruB [Nitrospirota bacterium]